MRSYMLNDNFQLACVGSDFWPYPGEQNINNIRKISRGHRDTISLEGYHRLDTSADKGLTPAFIHPWLPEQYDKGLGS